MALALYSPTGDPTAAREAVLDTLLATGAIDRPALARARLVAQRTNQPVEQALNQLGGLSDDGLTTAYAEVTGLPIWVPAAQPPSAETAALEITSEFLRRTRTLPLEVGQDRLLCATCDPLNLETVAGLEFATGLQVELLIARPQDWRVAFDAQFPQSSTRSGTDPQRLEREIDLVSDLGAASVGARVVSSAFEMAIQVAASDIHFEPRRHDLRVRLRVDGRMVDHLTVSPDDAPAVVSRVKVIANLDVGERRLPQDGRTSFVVGGRTVDVRVATSPTVFGESAVLRILDRSTVRLELPALGFSERLGMQLRHAVQSPHGMFLISGPTGSGKTTTLYTLLQAFAGSPKKVLSVEDPVEYHFDHVTQTQVAPAIGLTFAATLRSFLRQDPDVILVGEIRDAETASVAVQAAMTGHLVLASVHANDALSVIPRLLDMGVEPFQLAAGLRGAAAQRLVRRLCPACSAPSPTTEVEAAFMVAAGVAPPSALPRAQGCPTCNGIGFKGRLAIAEIVLADSEFLRGVAEQIPLAGLAEAARDGGYAPMAHDAAAKIAGGQTTLEEVMAALHG